MKTNKTLPIGEPIVCALKKVFILLRDTAREIGRRIVRKDKVVLTAIFVLIIDIILLWQVFHFNTNGLGHIFASLLVYAILSILIFPIVFWFISLFEPGFYKSDKSLNDSKFDYITKSFLFPIIGGLVVMAISEKISPTRVEVKIAITDFEPEPNANVAQEYDADYIQPAVQNLGDYGDVISLKLEKIGKPYDNILDALKNGRVDLAVVSPFTYIFYQKLGDKTFSESLKVVGLKFPNTGGHHYFSGFVFNKAHGDTIRQMLRFADGIDPQEPKPAKRIRLILSDESLSTSGRIVPVRWLLERKLDDSLVKKADYLPAKEMLPLIVSDKGYFGALSTNQWEIFQKTNPLLAERLEFYPLEEVPIPFDPLMANDSIWNAKFDNWYHLMVDFFLLRNLDLNKTRQDIILEALRGIVQPVKDKKEWDNHNKHFVDYLFTGIVKDSNSIIFPEPYSQLGYLIGYKNLDTGSMVTLDTAEFREPIDSKRQDDWYSFDYPYEIEKDTLPLKLLKLYVQGSATFIPGFQEVSFSNNLYLDTGRLVFVVSDKIARKPPIGRKNLPGRRFNPLANTEFPPAKDTNIITITE